MSDEKTGRDSSEVTPRLVRCWCCTRDVPEETTMGTGSNAQCKDTDACRLRYGSKLCMLDVKHQGPCALPRAHKGPCALRSEPKAARCEQCPAEGVTDLADRWLCQACVDRLTGTVARPNDAKAAAGPFKIGDRVRYKDRGIIRALPTEPGRCAVIQWDGYGLEDDETTLESLEPDAGDLDNVTADSVTLPLAPTNDPEITCIRCRERRPVQYGVTMRRSGETALLGIHESCLPAVRTEYPNNGTRPPSLLGNNEIRDCWCHECLDAPEHGPLNPTARMMILCPACGNKRCPRATDHRFACTGSNEPGQFGSNYGVRIDSPNNDTP